MSKYTCQLCHKVFNQKIDFTRHAAKKSPCVSIEVIQTMAQTAVAVNDNKAKLSTLFHYCLDVLRNNEHLTGDKALRTLAHLLDLRLLEYQFGKQIDIDGFAYDLSAYDCDVNELKSKLLRVVRFSNLAKENEENIPNIMKILWDEILCVHPITRNIFAKGKGFDIQHQSTYKKLIDKLFDFDFDAMDNDILGEAYEEVIKDVMTGKVLGQFFTPPAVKNILVDLVDPQIHKDGTIETVFDPAMGTGGFLITCLRHLQQKAKKNNQLLDWDFITSQGVGGREAEPDTFQLAVSNLLIASGRMFKSLEKGDSIRDPITNKYDIILANPPFGIDGLIYTEIMHPLRNEYMPISSNSAVPLFLQAIIHMLKIGGRCAVILPEGQELFSKNKALVAVRQYLMTTCDLKEVIYLPAGTFTHTSIKTCVFHFHKKKEGKDVLETKMKYSKTTQSETERNYVFHESHQTTKVGFYDCNPENGVRHLLLEVNIADIANKNYSLNYAEYLKDETVDVVYDKGVVVKTLGEVCKFDIGGTPSRSKNEYYENGNNLWISVRELNGGYIYDTKEKITDLGVQNSSVKLFVKDTILFSFKLSIGKTAIVGNPLYTNEAIAGIVSKNNDVLNNKYLYYYLTINDFSKLGSGILGNGSLNKKSLEQIKILIPSLERQQEIVKYLDFIYEITNKTSSNKIAELKQLNTFCLNNQTAFGENVVKTLGEVCDFKNGKGIKKDTFVHGEYPVIGGGQKPMGFHNEYNTNENTILCSSSGAYAGFISKYDKKVWASDCFTIIPKYEAIENNYLYYMLKITQDKIYKSQTGTAQPHVYSKDLQDLKIHIPSIERQREIVEYCEYNDTLILQLEREIEQNKTQAKMFISGILKEHE